MKKFLVIFSIVAVIATSALLTDKAHAQSRDLCGGTGGNGQIVSIGSDAFVLKLRADARNGGDLTVNLTPRATIETPTGYASASDLKIGDRVTLVGDNHGDGTFTADAVVVCSGTGAIGTEIDGAGQPTPIAVRNGDSDAYERASGMVDAGIYLLFGSVWLGLSAFLLIKKKKSLVYLLFFTIFYVYLYKVLDYTLLQFQSLLLLQHFLPDLMLNGFKDGTNVNLIPLAALRLEDVKTSLLNILMMLPFGFGLPFITDLRFKKVVLAGLIFSIAIESLQLITGFMANTTFRVADVNDLIFNALGAAFGYALFVWFVRIYRRIFPAWGVSKNPILRYIAKRPQVDR